VPHTVPHCDSYCTTLCLIMYHIVPHTLSHCASYCTTLCHILYHKLCLILYHKSPINLRQCVRSILQNIVDAQPGLKEDQPCHLATHYCGKLEVHVSVDSLAFSCMYPSASGPVTSYKIFIHIKVLLVKWKTLHLQSFFNSISLRLSLVQRFLLYIL
jgi:hypothetical protein